jgi:hypothetical protein
MTDPSRASPLAPADGDDLSARVFRALYQAYDLRTVAGIHVAVPKGSPCFTGPSPGAIARQISDHEHLAPPAAGPAPVPLPQPRRHPPRTDATPDPQDPPPRLPDRTRRTRCPTR